MNSIFVSVVSYRDSLLRQTVLDLLDKMSGQNRIVVGIFEQTRYYDSLAYTDPNLTILPNVRYKRIDPVYSEGCAWARHINSMQMRDEEFFYQIDSHMLFDKDWDVALIEDWNLGKEKHGDNKTIISTSCKGFNVIDGISIVNPNFDDPPITAVMKVYDFEPVNMLPGVHGDWIPATEDIMPGIHGCGGNFFTHAEWVREIGIDPKMYFPHEEQKIVLVSFLAGYHLYHPRKMICYHYNGSGNYVTKPWCEPVMISEKEYSFLCDRSRRRWIEYLDSVGPEKLNQFYEYSGIDYVNKCFDERVRTYSIKVVPVEERPVVKSPWQ